MIQISSVQIKVGQGEILARSVPVPAIFVHSRPQSFTGHVFIDLDYLVLISIIKVQQSHQLLRHCMSIWLSWFIYIIRLS